MMAATTYLNNYTLVGGADDHRANLDNVLIVEVIMDPLHVHLVSLTLCIELPQMEEDGVQGVLCH